MCGSMKRNYIFILVFVIFILVITIVGTFFVTGNELIESKKDILNLQSNKEVYFTPYGYSIDNPLIITNPYGNSPLTAIALFETSDYSEVNICIKNKHNVCDITYSFAKDKYHLIPIYGLYSDYDNTVIISSEGKEKIVNIKTDILPNDFGEVLYNNDYSFYNGVYPYATDSNGDVRWYLSDKYFGDITIYGDNIVIGNNSYTEDYKSTGIYRMNLLGKIYSEYLLSDDYYGFNVYNNGYIYAISKDIVVIDVQTGNIALKYKNDHYDKLGIKDGNIVFGKEGKWFSYSGNDIVEIQFSPNENVYSFYDNISQYKIVKGIRYGSLNETEMYNKDISIIKYDKYKENDIKIEIDSNRISVYNDSEDDVYLILDKLFDKRIYKVDKVKYINLTALKGKYTVYYKINGKVYKTDYFIEV